MSVIDKVTVGGTTYDLRDTKAQNDCADLKSALTQITGNEKIPITGRSQYIDLSGDSVTMADGIPVISGSSLAYSYALTACQEGDTFTVNGTGGGQTRLWGFISDTGAILEKAANATTASNLILTAPANAAFLVIHGRTNDWATSYKGTLVTLEIDDLKKSLAQSGDDVTRLGNALNAVETAAQGVNASVAIGSISTAEGYSTDDTSARIRSVGYTPIDKYPLIAFCGENIKIRVFFYSKKGTGTGAYLGYVNWITTGNIDVRKIATQQYPTALYYRYCAGYNDERSISDASAMSTQIFLLPDVVEKKQFQPVSDAAYKQWAYGDKFPLKIGQISVGNGAVSPNYTNKAYTVFLPLSYIEALTTTDNVQMALRVYGASGYIDAYDRSWHAEIDMRDIRDYYKDTEANSLRIVLRYSDNSDITNVEDMAKHLQVTTLHDLALKHIVIERGSVGNRGAYGVDANRARVYGIVPVYEGLLIQWPDEYAFVARTYTRGLDYIGNNEWITAAKQYLVTPSVPENVENLRLVFKRTDDGNITDSDIAVLRDGVHVLTIDAQDEIVPSVSLSPNVLMQSPKDSVFIAPTMCAVKYKREDGKHPIPEGWLYRQNAEPYGFYWSPDGKTIQHLFDWDKTVTDTGARTPHEYSITVTDEGDILCVYRGELAYMKRTPPYRQNPIVYPRNDYAHPVVVDFGTDDPPTSWLQNTGVYAESGRVFICEYTRYGHANAYVWRALSPYTSKANWEITKTFAVSGFQRGFKHCHNIDRDPYTGILWLSTGDQPPEEGETYVGTPGIYYSQDNGDTWSTLLEGVEKYCRQLNFIWLEDYVYWSTDSQHVDRHYLIRAKRDANGIIDVSTIEDVWKWAVDQATYNLCYSEKPHGILILDRVDGEVNRPADIYFWNLDEQRMMLVGRLDPMGKGKVGFRVEACNHYPALNNVGYICGFGLQSNWINMPGNRYNDEYIDESGYVANDSANIGCLNNIVVKFD